MKPTGMSPSCPQTVPRAPWVNELLAIRGQLTLISEPCRTDARGESGKSGPLASGSIVSRARHIKLLHESPTFTAGEMAPSRTIVACTKRHKSAAVIHPDFEKKLFGRQIIQWEWAGSSSRGGPPPKPAKKGGSGSPGTDSVMPRR